MNGMDFKEGYEAGYKVKQVNQRSDYMSLDGHNVLSKMKGGRKF